MNYGGLTWKPIWNKTTSTRRIPQVRNDNGSPFPCARNFTHGVLTRGRQVKPPRENRFLAERLVSPTKELDKSDSDL